MSARQVERDVLISQIADEMVNHVSPIAAPAIKRRYLAEAFDALERLGYTIVRGEGASDG